MGGVNIGAGEHYPPPCKGAEDRGQNISCTYYTHVTKMYFTRLLSDVFYSVAWVYVPSRVNIASL